MSDVVEVSDGQKFRKASLVTLEVTCDWQRFHSGTYWKVRWEESDSRCFAGNKRKKAAA